MQIYIHIPFCVRKCNYCAFNSKVGREIEIENYVDALIKEISQTTKSYKLTTIYVGGGTPSTLNLAQLKKIFCAIEKNFFIEKAAEITIEVNPGTVDKNFLRGLHDTGFNRLSIGIQSFNDKLLKILGRVHDKKIAIETVSTAKNFFDNISVDLMYGLPNQTLKDIDASIDIAANLEVQHISIYGLEVEEGTNFFELNEKNLLNLPDENICSDMYDLITEKLPEFGYERYEISNFAKKNFESRHNLGYWTGKKYLGFGAGAHSYHGKLRTSNVCDVSTYAEKIFKGETVSEVEEIITTQAAMEEFCFLGLRTTQGISEKSFFDRFNKNIFDVYGKVIEKYVKLGMIKNCSGQIFLTERGMKISNMILSDFLL